ncbi:Arc family DNA-binding protein [Acerihabitans sp. TG2]|uniref:Arc family DNA-binding protein n=1 Tax=Acerihabitans sp. TG2 TaxID=3096008 RepID=UPI002B23DC2B|nr:Arc family DNA-binding protein [Acerihabitans sp. TG2]MEA9392683.1 Arc family DNA-binding protein [Acerihabitans sp. TG2]
MKIRENIVKKPGRPRKNTSGEVKYRVLLAPENLLLELRVAARVRGVSMSDEIIDRLFQSMNLEPKNPIINSQDGERLIALSRLFDEFIQAQLDSIREKHVNENQCAEKDRQFIPGKMKRFSSTFPVDLKKDIEISARFNQRSINQEIIQRLLGSLNYLTEQQHPENEEIKRLRSLAMLFDEFVTSKVIDAENPLTRSDKEKNESGNTL